MSTNEKNYVLEEDYETSKIFSNKTPFDLEMDALIEERSKYSHKDTFSTMMLAFFLGGFGVHRFVNGKKLTGLLYLCTAGCFLIGVLSDILQILSGKFTDENGRYINTAKAMKIEAKMEAVKRKYARQ